jgi:hypothetical protein
MIMGRLNLRPLQLAFEPFKTESTARFPKDGHPIRDFSFFPFAFPHMLYDTNSMYD